MSQNPNQTPNYGYPPYYMPYMYTYNTMGTPHMIPPYYATPQQYTPNQLQGNFGTPKYNAYQSYPSTPTPSYTQNQLQTPKSTPKSDSTTTTPTQDEIKAKFNQIAQEKRLQLSNPPLKKQKIDDTPSKSISLPQSFKRFQNKTYQANPHHHKEVEVYLKNILEEFKNKKEFYTINWDDVPITSFHKPQNTSTPKPTRHLDSQKDTDLSKYDYTKKPVYTPSSNRTNLRFNTPPVDSKPNFKQKHHQHIIDPSPYKLNNYDYQFTTPKPLKPRKPKAIIGTLLTLEKEYFRNADEPDPSNVRPEYILKQSFEFIKNKVLEGADWMYISNQMKSMRQDLVIQGIKNEFTVDVYETHARLCLENEDIDEYNRCQGKLKELYDISIAGNIFEFLSYRILYTVYTANSVDMNSILMELNDDILKREEIKHALKVREAIALNNWHQFFLLFNECPNMGRFIMKRMFRKVRMNAIKMLYVSFRPTIPVQWISNQLGFENLEECKNFLNLIKANFQNDLLNTKLSITGLKEYENQD